jgi:hypothetical protein
MVRDKTPFAWANNSLQRAAKARAEEFKCEAWTKCVELLFLLNLKSEIADFKSESLVVGSRFDLTFLGAG